MNDENPFGEVIYAYTRAQAIEDGVLVDLTEWASETGFSVPVTCTMTIWDKYVVPPDRTRECGQSERGRAHDLLWMLLNAIRRGGGAQDQVQFEVIFLMASERHETARLKAVCGPGDQGELVITIMLPHED